MSRSFNQKRKRRIVKNAFILKRLKCYGDELHNRNNRKYLNRILRARIKKEIEKELKEILF